MTPAEIVEQLRRKKIGKVTITGGEPFAQEKELRDLVEELLSWGYRISIETNGYHRLKEFKDIFPQVCLVVDFKLEKKPALENFIGLRGNDWVKFLVGSEEDMNTALHYTRAIVSVGSPDLAVSPIKPGLTELDVVRYIERNDCYYLKLNFQAHKLMNLK